MALVEAALREHGEVWEHQVEVKKNAIVVYESGSDIDGISEIAIQFGRRPLSETEKSRYAHYMAVMRFLLEDKDARMFTTERLVIPSLSRDLKVCRVARDPSASSG